MEMDTEVLTLMIQGGILFPGELTTGTPEILD